MAVRDCASPFKTSSWYPHFCYDCSNSQLPPPPLRPQGSFFSGVLALCFAMHCMACMGIQLCTHSKFCTCMLQPQLIWPGLFERHGGRLPYEFDISTLAHISEGYSSGALDGVVSGLLASRCLERLRLKPVDLPEIIQWLSKVWGTRVLLRLQQKAVRQASLCGLLVKHWPSLAVLMNANLPIDLRPFYCSQHQRMSCMCCY